MHVAHALDAACTQCEAEQSHLLVLLDTAPVEGAYQELQRLGVSFESLFDHSPEESLIEIAPLLFEASAAPAALRPRLFAWLQDLAYASPCLSWCRSERPLSDVAAHLRRFHVVDVSDGQSMIMRWYDTRVLPIWLACLGADQAAAFTAGTWGWQYVDRSGAVVMDPVQGKGVPFPAVKPLGQQLIALNDQQLALLVGAADLDVLLSHLRRIIPDELGQVEPKRLAAFVGRYQQQAIEYGLKDIDRQAQFVILALYTSGRGIERPELKAYMKKPPADRKGFSDGLQALPDTVWEAGPPLWESNKKADLGDTNQDSGAHA
jgi:hypothetical protein